MKKHTEKNLLKRVEMLEREIERLSAIPSNQPIWVYFEPVLPRQPDQVNPWFRPSPSPGFGWRSPSWVQTTSTSGTALG